MSTTNSPLKYLFTAEYEDGTYYIQPPDDISKLHKGTEDFTPSSFRDVDHEKLVRFSLAGGGEKYSVDLRSGEFTVNGTTFTAEEQNTVLIEPRQLIYFREVRQEFVGGVPQDAFVNRYFIGWQAKDDKGRNHKYTIGVK